MIALFLIAQLAAAVPSDTGTYSSPALRRIVASAAALNRRVPPRLGSYRAELESEVQLTSARGDGAEAVISIEQIASTLTWNRSGATEQNVIGYRSQALGTQLPTIGFLKNAWAVPSLYGNRLSLMFGQDTSTRRLGRRRADPVLFAVHPLADDRERFYRFSGGDTIQTLRVGDRVLSIVRIQVTPRAAPDGKSVLFTGELDLDASRSHVVRMRGHFDVVGDKPSIIARALRSTVDGLIYVELENSERDGAYWLPSYQRFEAQVTIPAAGDGRTNFRILTRFHDLALSPPTIADAGLDSIQAMKHPLHIAPRDSLAAYRSWLRDLGALSVDARAGDFEDVAPAKYRSDGAPQIAFQTERATDLAHFNRVEGLYAGGGVTAKLRDLAPGVTLRAIAGYAWSERTARGRVVAELHRAKTTWAFRAGRSLDLTNDFRSPFDSGQTLAAVFGRDDYDYVDRRFALASVTHVMSAERNLTLYAELGAAQDKYASAALQYGLFRTGDPFRQNRQVTRGDYAKSVLELRRNPDLDATRLRPGASAVLRYERGDGQLNYQRVELRLMTRANHGPWTLAGRFDAGALLGSSPPPQQLFEVGQNEGLAAYEYKEFAGDHAAGLRGLVSYRLPLLRSPIHIFRQFWLPEPGPSLALILQSGWTEASTPGARAAVAALGSLNGNALSRPTGDVRSSVSAGLRFFGGSMGVMVTRPLDHTDQWRLKFDANPQP
jgi:hypothetical protein